MRVQHDDGHLGLAMEEGEYAQCVRTLNLLTVVCTDKEYVLTVKLRTSSSSVLISSCSVEVRLLPDVLWRPFVADRELPGLRWGQVEELLASGKN